jgi:molybdate transport system ATP-binding protein
VSPDRSLVARFSLAPTRDGRPALEVALEAPPGITVLFGPSGAGKTTALAVVAGLIRPDRGRIAVGPETLFDREAGIDLPPHRRRVALVFQSLALFPHLTALDNVAYGLPRALGRAARRALAREWLERTRAAHVADRRPATLSGGEAQRIALARALAASPRVLLLDEPFTALDEGLRRELGGLVRELADELAIPTILVTHDRRDALALGDRAVVLGAGRTVAAGAVPDALGGEDLAAPAPAERTRRAGRTGRG